MTWIMIRRSWLPHTRARLPFLSRLCPPAVAEPLIRSTIKFFFFKFLALFLQNSAFRSKFKKPANFLCRSPNYPTVRLKLRGKRNRDTTRMVEVQKAFPPNGHERDSHKRSGKRKSSEFKGKELSAPNAEKKRKFDRIQHVPNLVSSTFNPLEEVDFPRGGPALTPLEKKEAENEGIRDALFEVSQFVIVS